MYSSSSFYVTLSRIILLNPLNIAVIVGVVCVLAFAVVLIQPENTAKSQYDETKQIETHDGMMEKHYSMINSSSYAEHTISVTGIAQNK